MKFTTKHSHYWKVIPGLSIILFTLGLIGGVSFRATIFLKPLGDNIVELAWYIGVSAYIIFFYLRISIENHRREVCGDKAFFQRIKNNQMTHKDTEILTDIIGSQCRSNIKYNYMIWFGLSVVSIIVALIFV